MYHRRTVLAAGGASLASLSFAGCLGDDDSNSDPGEEDDDSNGDPGEDDDVSDNETDDDGDASEPDPEAREHIDGAAASLEAALAEFEAALEETEDPTDGGSHAIETRPITALLDDAETDLEAAREDATDEQLETIDALEETIDFFRDVVETVAALGDALDEYEAMDSYMERERYDDAVDALERAQEHIDEANEQLITARSTFEDIDPDALEDLDDLDYVEMEVALDEMDDALWAIDVMTVGLRQMVQGLIPFESALEALEADRFDDAATEFENASNEFYAAHTTFGDAEADAPAEFRDDFIDLSCTTEALSDAASEFGRGCEALDGGREDDAEEHFEAAEEALVRVDECGGLED